MEHLKTFLDTSTIHGLSWIVSTKRLSRLFWILTVIGGFTGAIYIIYESFSNWGKNPVTTTIETMPISEITFPNVTVCPPKSSFLNLNYDILQSEKVELNIEARKELLDYAFDVIQDEFYNEMMTNQSKVQYTDRYYNWYHGLTSISYVYHENKQLKYSITTTATSGNITTQSFGEKIEADKLEPNIDINIVFYSPTNVIKDRNITLKFDIDKISFLDNENFYFTAAGGDVDADITIIKQNITAPLYTFYYMSLDRNVYQRDIVNSGLKKTPGFKITWKYNKKVDAWSWDKYTGRFNGYKELQLEFVR